VRRSKVSFSGDGGRGVGEVDGVGVVLVVGLSATVGSSGCGAKTKIAPSSRATNTTPAIAAATTRLRRILGDGLRRSRRSRRASSVTPTAYGGAPLAKLMPWV
jgi:hypothetical protein